MKFTIGQPREITLDIHLRPYREEDGHLKSGALGVYVDDWSWDGPPYSIDKAIERLHYVEEDFERVAASHEPGRVYGQYERDGYAHKAIEQRLNGERAHHPEEGEWEYCATTSPAAATRDRAGLRTRRSTTPSSTCPAGT